MSTPAAHSIPSDTVAAHAASFSLPEEVYAVPHVHIALFGLEPATNAAHRAIVDMFGACRSVELPGGGVETVPPVAPVGGAAAGATAPSPVSTTPAATAPAPAACRVYYSVLPLDHKFPASKSSRPGVETGLARGLVKRHWLAKHLYHMPALVVVFFRLDWHQPDWHHQLQLCSSRLNSVRTALGSHVTRVALILVQHDAAGGGGGGGAESLAAQRYSQLCSACNLSANSLWVLPVDHLSHSYVTRLQAVLLELALSYYHHRLKMARAARELSPSGSLGGRQPAASLQLSRQLLVRQQFKIGFFSQVLQPDSSAALKAYQTCFSCLSELPLADWQPLAVAALVSYKICRIALNCNAARDAVVHFQRHVALLTAAAGGATYSRFAQSASDTELLQLAGDSALCRAWLCQQYVWFGQLLASVAQQGVASAQQGVVAAQQGVASAQQHSAGLYYETGAMHARHRRLLATLTAAKLCDTEYPSPDPLAGLADQQFVGQCPYPGPLPSSSSSADGGDPDGQWRRRALAVALLESRAVDFASQVLPLLSAAVAHHRRHNCRRRAARLTCAMATEYAAFDQHDKAVALLQQILPVYTAECWWPLLVPLATSGLYSSFISASVAPYILMSSVLLSQPSLSSAAAAGGEQGEALLRAELDANFHRILNREAPLPLSVHQLREQQCRVATAGWHQALASCRLPVQVDLAHTRLPAAGLLLTEATFNTDRFALATTPDHHQQQHHHHHHQQQQQDHHHQQHHHHQQQHHHHHQQQQEQQSELAVHVHVRSTSRQSLCVVSAGATVESGGGGAMQCGVNSRLVLGASPASVSGCVPVSLQSLTHSLAHPPQPQQQLLCLNSWHVTVTAAAAGAEQQVVGPVLSDRRTLAPDDNNPSIAVCFTWRRPPLGDSANRPSHSGDWSCSAATDHLLLQCAVAQRLAAKPRRLGCPPSPLLSVLVWRVSPWQQLRVRVCQPAPPALLGELYHMLVEIGSASGASSCLAPLTGAPRLVVTALAPPPGPSAAGSAPADSVMLIDGDSVSALSSAVTLPCGPVGPGSSVQVPLTVQCLNLAPPALQVEFQCVDSGGGELVSVTDTVQLQVVQPFQAVLRLLNGHLEPVERVAAGDEILLAIEITSTSPHPLVIHYTLLDTSDSVFESVDSDNDIQCHPSTSCDNDHDREHLTDTAGQVPPAAGSCGADRQGSPLLCGQWLCAGGAVAECRQLVAGRNWQGTGQTGPLALTVHWSRCGSEKARFTEHADVTPSSPAEEAEETPPAAGGAATTVMTVASLPMAPVAPPVAVTARLPAAACVGSSVAVQYDISAAEAVTGALAGAAVRLTVEMEANNSFLVQSVKQIPLHVAPGQTRTLSYTLYPLTPGCAPLPQLRISLATPTGSDSAQSQELDQQQAALRHALSKLPRHLFVLPESKSESVETGGLGDLEDQLALMHV